MSYFYGILAVTGWVWLAIALSYLSWRLRRERRRPPPGFELEVARSDEKQS